MKKLFTPVVVSLTLALFFSLLTTLGASSPAWAIDPVDVDAGTTADYVDVASATVGVRIGPNAIKTALRVQVKGTSASPVCFNYVDRLASCGTALIDPDKTGFCLAQGGAYVFPVAEEHFRGQVCAINFTSGTSRVGWNAW